MNQQLARLSYVSQYNLLDGAIKIILRYFSDKFIPYQMGYPNYPYALLHWSELEK
jgi:hypothetical protein